MILLFIIELIALGIAGITERRYSLRIVLWIISLPLHGIGILALIQGGIADPLTKKQMVMLCILTLWPAIGCSIGQFRLMTSK